MVTSTADIPKFLRLTPAQRKAGWVGVPMTTLSSFVPRPVDDTEEKRKVQARIDALARIDRMKSKAAVKVADSRMMRLLRLGPGLPSKDYDRLLVEFKEVGPEAVAYFTRSYLKGEDGRYRRAGIETPSAAKAPKQPTPPRGNVDDVSSRLAGVTRPALKLIAQTNDIWKDDYDKLDNGRFRMVIGNRLRAMVKNGKAVTW